MSCITKSIKYKFCLLYFTLMVLLVHHFAGAASLNYQACHMPWDFGDVDKNSLMIRPLGNKCYTICQNQCKEFSQASQLGLTGIELNQDIIDECLFECQKGNGYSSSYRIEDNSPSNISGWKWAPTKITINAHCSTGSSDVESADFAYYPTDFSVNTGDIVNISLGSSDSGYGNTVFLCGFQTKRITPQTFEPSPSFNNQQAGSDSNWDARKNSWYDTGVPIKSGDYVRIAYGGKFLGVFKNGQYHPTKNDLDMSFNGSCKDGSYFPGENLPTCFIEGSGKDMQSFCTDGNNNTVNCKNGGCSNISQNAGQKNTNFCSLMPSRTSIVRSDLMVNENAQSYYPLDKFAFEGYIDGFTSNSENLQIKYKDDYVYSVNCQNEQYVTGRVCTARKTGLDAFGCALESLVGISDECCATWENTYGTRKVCKDSNNNIVQAPSDGSMSGSVTLDNDYSNNFGGYEVEVSKKGCPHRNGDGLQYAIVPPKKDELSGQTLYRPWDSDVSWSDAAGYFLSGNSNTIPVNTAGKLYFRIDPSKITGGSAATLGSYGVIVSKTIPQAANTAVSGVISDVVNNVTQFFIGDDGNDGKSGRVQYIFNQLIQDPNIINSIRALLMLYVAYTGLSYMVGFAKTTQKEAVTRVLKIALVVTLISPGSWAFFNTFLFSLMLNAGMELTYDMIQPFGLIGQVNIATATHAEMVQAVFGMYDKIFAELFGNVIWIKIWALICTNLTGLLFAMLIIIALISYVICALRVVSIYLISTITLCILFLLAPIFISFILFDKTNKLFKSWINNMLSMVFQPVFAFIAIAVLHEVFIMTLHAALSFTACPTCLMEFDILGSQWCIPGKDVWWVALYGAHFPSQATIMSPVNLVLAPLAVIILAQAMDGMVKFAVQFANKIATNSFFGFDLGGVSGSMQEYVSSGAQAIAKTALGIKETDGENKESKDDKKNDTSNTTPRK